MSSLNGRIIRLEKQLETMTWQQEVQHLVRRGKVTALDVLHDFGTVALETWPEWYKEYDQEEVNRLTEEAEEYIAALVASCASEAEFVAMWAS